MSDFDLECVYIGNVHGHARTLLALLGQLRWKLKNGSPANSRGQKLVFVGDLAEPRGSCAPSKPCSRAPNTSCRMVRVLRQMRPVAPTSPERLVGSQPSPPRRGTAVPEPAERAQRRVFVRECRASCLPEDVPPVVFGYYWWSGPLEKRRPNALCIGYSIGKGDRLIAYSGVRGEEANDVGVLLANPYKAAITNALHSSNANEPCDKVKTRASSESYPILHGKAHRY